MSILLIMIGSAVVLYLAGRFYAPVIGRVLGEKLDRVTPAVQINDGRDYVPTRTPVVFAHHYASIAGAGPIVGPVLAVLYGWGPSTISPPPISPCAKAVKTSLSSLVAISALPLLCYF